MWSFYEWTTVFCVFMIQTLCLDLKIYLTWKGSEFWNWWLHFPWTKLDALVGLLCALGNMFDSPASDQIRQSNLYITVALMRLWENNVTTHQKKCFVLTDMLVKLSEALSHTMPPIYWSLAFRCFKDNKDERGVDTGKTTLWCHKGDHSLFMISRTPFECVLHLVQLQEWSLQSPTLLSFSFQSQKKEVTRG